MLELYFALHLLCVGPMLPDRTNCESVVVGHDAPRDTYALTTWGVPAKDRHGYGPIWLQIGSDADWGIHGYPNFGHWQVGKVRSHGCIRVSQSMLKKISDFNPSSLLIK
jgi:L,D-transpeptidase catalytic domain